MRLVLLPVVVALIASTPAYATWREASSDHFVIYSEEDENSLKQFATRLERYDSAMRIGRDLPEAAVVRANRLTVYVVSSLSAVQRLYGSGSANIAGFYVPSAGNSMAIIPRKAGDGGQFATDPEIILLHEYAHHFLFQNFAAAYPAWFAEGFAEFNSTARFEKDGSVGLGLPAHHRAYGLALLSPLPIERMMDPGPKRLDQEQTESLYGRGWLLTHYLTFEPSRAGQLNKYLDAFSRGKSGLDAATSAFGDLRRLERELGKYYRRSRMQYIRFNTALIKPGPVAIRTLRPGEDAVMEAKIRSHRGVTIDQAKALLPEMRRLAAPFPTDPATQAALAEAEYDVGNFRESEAAADRALAADPKFMHALLYKGMAKAQHATETAADSDWKEARRLFAAANRIDPDNPRPLILFYQSFRQQGVPASANAVMGLNRAFELAPEDGELRAEVARQFLIDGKGKEARAALMAIAYAPHSGDAGKTINAVIEKIDSDGPLEALKFWDDENARETEKKT
jgi:tetratricopeptide (TPR) repeat protein